MKIVLVAEESAGQRVFDTLAKSGHELATVFTSEKTRLWSMAEEAGAPVLPAASIRKRQTAEALEESAPDLLLNVHSLYLLPKRILRVPRIGCFNLHPGPLPRYAGLNAPSWAIYNGETSHGATLHEMAAGIDTGRIAYGLTFPITERETGLTLSVKCAKAGMLLIQQLLEAASSDPSSIPLTEQDLALRSYYGHEVPHDGWIRWNEPANRIHDFVRASSYSPYPSPWGTPRADLNGQEVGIVRTMLTGEPSTGAHGQLESRGDGVVAVSTADQWLKISKIEIDGKVQDASELLRLVS